MTSRAPAERTPLDQRLRTEPTVWLSSTRPDGRPHVVPVWFSWDGSVFDLFSKPHAQKVRNLREHPDVMLALGKPEAEWDVELVEGTATVLDAPTADVVAPTMFEKYAALMARAALDRETFVATYSQPVRIQPTRFLGYGGKGWTDPALTPDGDDDVSGHLMRPQRLGEAQAALVAELRRVTRRLRRGTAIELLALED
ncbi:MAG TPA: pyridoxamine 5'-phosphate oxidase family protein [Candidatus Limnocylindria bacterium]|nr:pyridoxamine 5'-phosphate oxidase family protein [Candidatus Limnocylindria bacterium]